MCECGVNGQHKKGRDSKGSATSMKMLGVHPCASTSESKSRSWKMPRAIQKGEFSVRELLNLDFSMPVYGFIFKFQSSGLDREDRLYNILDCSGHTGQPGMLFLPLPQSLGLSA